MTPQEAWAHLLRHIGHWTLLGYGVFAIEDKATGRFVGEVGLCDFSRRLDPDFDRCAEATWSIAPEFQGRGLATEAARGALVGLEARRERPRSVCLIHEENRASLRVAEKLGFRPFARRTFRTYPAILLERLR